MYVIPMMPSIAMIIAVIGTVILVLEMLAAAPLWMVAHAYAGGDDFAPQQASYGYGAMVGVLVRPIALVFGFVFMYYMLNVSLWLMGTAFSMAFGGMTMTSTVGPVATVFLIAVILGGMFMVIRLNTRMVTHLADNLPNWMGGRSTNVPGGQEGVQEAQNIQSATQRAATGGGLAIRQGVKEAQQDKKSAAEKAAATKEAQRKEGKEDARWAGLQSAIESLGSKTGGGGGEEGGAGAGATGLAKTAEQTAEGAMAAAAQDAVTLHSADGNGTPAVAGWVDKSASPASGNPPPELAGPPPELVGPPRPPKNDEDPKV